MRTDEVVGVFLAPVEDACHGGANGGEFASIHKGSAHQSSLLSYFEEALEEILVVSASLYGVEGVSLLSCKHDFDWVGYDSCKEATSNASIGIKVRSGLASRVLVDFVIEVQKAGNARRRVGEGPQEKAVKRSIEASQSTSCFHNFLTNLSHVVPSEHSYAVVCFSFLEHLSSDLNQIQGLQKRVSDQSN